MTTPNSSAQPPLEQPDDISLFLRQLIHRSSPSSQPFVSPPSSSPPMRTHADNHLNQHQFSSYGTAYNPGPSAVFTGSDRLVVDRISRDSLGGVVLPPTNLSSDSLSSSVQFNTFDNNDYAEDNDYESEEGNDAAVEGVETKRQLSRNQSKRSRAAEVHNLSEKRRRSRINEKMKALQNLIPNSNKTDKASMLDEAIEYLKQLQLQVQMLSMRNGLSLHPMCLPGGQGMLHPSQLSQLGIDYDNDSGTYDINMTNALNPIAESSNTTMLNLPNQCTSSGKPSLPMASTAINSETMSFGLESCTPADFRPFQHHNPQAVSKEQSMPHHRLIVDNFDTKPLVTTSARPHTFGVGDSSVKGHTSVEGRMQQKHGSHETFRENISGQNQRIFSNFSGVGSGGAQMTS
nr:hypothetical protein [Suaeda aralocaspica]